MPTSQKTTFGATIEPLSQPPPFYPGLTNDSTESLIAPPPRVRMFSGTDEASNPANPYSAFYTHPSTRLSLEQIRGEHGPVTPLQGHHDVEAGLSKTKPSFFCVTRSNSSGKPSTEISTKAITQADTSVWPSRKELEEKAMMVKKEESRKNWNCLGGLSKKHRIMLRVLIGLLVAAVAVGLGVGISRAVGGGVWKGDGQTTTIPESN